MRSTVLTGTAMAMLAQRPISVLAKYCNLELDGLTITPTEILFLRPGWALSTGNIA